MIDPSPHFSLFKYTIKAVAGVFPVWYRLKYSPQTCLNWPGRKPLPCVLLSAVIKRHKKTARENAPFFLFISVTG